MPRCTAHAPSAADHQQVHGTGLIRRGPHRIERFAQRRRTKARRERTEPSGLRQHRGHRRRGGPEHGGWESAEWAAWLAPGAIARRSLHVRHTQRLPACRAAVHETILRMNRRAPSHTARLQLHPFAAHDVRELLALFRDPHVRRYLLDDELVDEAWVEGEIRSSQERFERGGLGLLTARLRSNGALVGFAGLRPFAEPEPQLIYGILPAYTGKGIATELARAVVDAAFLLCGAPFLTAAADVPNTASGRVLERLGFAKIGRAPSPVSVHEQLRFLLPREHYRPRIRDASASDRDAVRAVLTAAFDRSAEAELVEALEAGGHVAASLVATIGDEPVAHILFTELPLLAPEGDRRVRGVALAPVSVRPDVQRRGLGAALITAGLESCRARGAEAAVVLGHAAYYPRFGFSAQRAAAIRAPWSGPSFMALDLVPGALDLVPGALTAVYAPPFLRSGTNSH